jgi:hypothetical protein
VELAAGGVDVLVAGVLATGVLAAGVLDGAVPVVAGTLGLVLVDAAGGMGTLQAGVLSTAASPVATDGSAAPASRPLNTLA